MKTSYTLNQYGEITFKEIDSIKDIYLIKYQSKIKEVTKKTFELMWNRKIEYAKYKKQLRNDK